VRLAVVASHPIQYYAPFFREVGRRLDLKVFFAHRATPADQAKAGFGVGFDWDIDVLGGYESDFLENVAREPGIDRFAACDTPEIHSVLASGRFDAVLVQGWHLKAYLQAIYAAKRLGLPLLARGDSQLVTPRSTLKSAGKNIVYPTFLRLFDGALYVGKRSYTYWRHYRFPSSRLFFSPHSIDTEWFGSRATVQAGEALRQRAGVAAGEKIALFAGKLVPFKRPFDLVEAMGLLRRQGREISVLIAGAGELRDAISARAADLQVPCYDLGFCNQSEMPAVYAASNVLVLPSDGHETWGLVANEALACGCPIIVSDAVGAGPDLVDTDETGRVFPLADVAALAKAIEDVFVSPSLPQAIAAKSRAYSLSAAADGVMAALQRIK
jgi:glycosyltransferase involved in cell wall biosynthesis